jgi:hypothetical protein
MLLARFRRAVSAAGGTETIAGSSVEGRPLVRFDLGTPGRPVILMTALMHGVEVIGSLALLDLLEKLADDQLPGIARLRSEAHIVVLPVVNPDAFVANMTRVTRGDRAWQRCNAHGVDLNRNFPRLTAKRLLHPFSGSRFKFSPHYMGPHWLSEPETRAVYHVASEVRPVLSLAFHSFGNLVLYPWAYSARENERASEYRGLGGVMTKALRQFPYRVRQARDLYSVLGDMDDWLDAEFGTLAFTIEVGRLGLRLGDLSNPFRWMNPRAIRPTLDNLTPGVLALLGSAFGTSSVSAHFSEQTDRAKRSFDLAAK